MALPRKDARTALDPPVHAQLTMYADHDHVTVAEYIEKLIVKDVSDRTNDAIETVARLTSLGITRKIPDPVGKP